MVKGRVRRAGLRGIQAEADDRDFGVAGMLSGPIPTPDRGRA